MPEYNEFDVVRDTVKLVELLEQWTRAEIMARLGQFIGRHPKIWKPPDWCGYWNDKIELEDKIRKFIWGSSDLGELAKIFRMPYVDAATKSKKKKQNPPSCDEPKNGVGKSSDKL